MKITQNVVRFFALKMKSVALAGLILGTLPIQAQVYDANTLFAADPSVPTFGPFSVGYSDDLTNTSAFNIYTMPSDVFASTPEVQGFYFHNNAIVPAAVVNTTDSAVELSYGAILGAHQILLHEGGITSDAYAPPIFSSVLRFTAASAGLYSYFGSFEQIHTGTVTSEVYINGSLVSGGYGLFSGSGIFLNAGGVIDFAVSDNGLGIGGDSTGLYATVVAVPEPTTAALIGIGLLLVANGRARRRR